jgi:hypothetical protein
MEKIDKSSSFISKLLPDFLLGSRKNHLVIGIDELKFTNSLFVAVKDYSEKNNSFIDIYDLGREGDEFKKIETIKLQELFDLLAID